MNEDTQTPDDDTDDELSYAELRRRAMLRGIRCDKTAVELRELLGLE